MDKYVIKLFKETEAVILANGEYPTAEIPQNILLEAPYVVCCDGAANKYIDMGFLPDAIVGDGDSLKEEYRKRFASILYCIDEQESNDQTKAVQFLLKQEKRHIVIVGATGKREDHTLGNISLLIEYARMGATVCTCTDYGIFIPCSGKCTMQSYPGQQISIFNFTAKEFRSTGLKYPLFDFTNWWQGTLNECTGDEFTIDAEGEYILFINYK